MNAIEITNLTKTLGSFQLRLSKMTVQRGLITGFIGQNGSGKTTTIKLLMNMLFADTGQINILGKDINDNFLSTKQQIGYAGDKMGFTERLTLKQIAYTISPFFEQWDDDLFSCYIKRFHLDLHKRYSELSKGMKQQFDLIIALAHHPQLLLLDEPTANLDPLARDELLEILRELTANENVSVFFSTHITSDLEKIADHIIFLHQGTIIMEGDKDDLLENHRLIKGKTAHLVPEVEDLFLHISRNQFGFEALTANWRQAYDVLGDEAIYDKASLEDVFIGYVQNQR